MMEHIAISERLGYWKRRTRLERKLMIFAGMATFVILAFIIATCLYFATRHPRIHNHILNGTNTLEETNNDFSQTSQVKGSVCLSADCVKTAASVLQSMDINADPCDDFYRFACGRFVDDTKIPDDKTQVDSFTVVNDKLRVQLKLLVDAPIESDEPEHFKTVKKYYKSCMDIENLERIGLTKLQTLLKQLGGWPVVEGADWKSDDFEWINTMYTFRKLGMNKESVVNFGVDQDFKNTTIRVLEFDQPAFGIHRRYLANGKDDDIVKAYFQYMIDIAVLLGVEKEKAHQELTDSLDFEIQLAKTVLTEEDRRNFSVLYNIFTISELEKEFPTIPWLDYINTMLTKSVQVTNSEKVIVTEPKHIHSLESLLKRTPKRTLANYVIWQGIKPLVTYLNEEAMKIRLKLISRTTGQNERESRWKECIGEVTENFPLLISALYIRKYFDEHSKATALEMVKYIKIEFMKTLKDVDWMDEKTKKNALEKAKAMQEYIAYPDELLDDKELAKQFKKLIVDQDQYLLSKLNISKFNTDFDFNRFKEPVNKTNWIDHGNAAVVNAFYQPAENSIVFPAGILQSIFFESTRPKYMNFAAIGSVIGHEITHGFDDEGSQFDKNGDLTEWWAKDTKLAFLEKAHCIIEQYNNYTIPGIPGHVLGIETQGENIADNGGIKQAYRAYHSWLRNASSTAAAASSSGGGVVLSERQLPGLDYTAAQMFWIAAAQIWCSTTRPEQLKTQLATDPHSPTQFRVHGPFSNNREFAGDFECALGSRMNPEKKCTVW